MRSIEKRPLRDYSARERDLLAVLASSPGVNGAELHRTLEQIQGDRTSPRWIYDRLGEYHDAGLVRKKPVDERENKYFLTRAGRDLLLSDLIWLNEIVMQ